jgi:predicted thioredoxin/glutaredoxin
MIKIREERLERLDTVKFEVAAWLMAKGLVEDKTLRSQPKPAKHEEVVDQVVDKKGEDERPEEAA